MLRLSNIKVIFTILNLVIVSCLSAQTVRISGLVKDQESGEALIGVNIIEQESGKGTTTDYNGFFSIIIKAPVILEVSYVGYNSYSWGINQTVDSVVTILLKPGAELDEVVISAQGTRNFNIATLNNKELQQIPSIGAMPDVTKALQLLPGINSQNEGSSLLLVRGGDPGQNLYLLDNVPVIYVHHLGGFSSVFNPDIINNIDVYKGGFPARYGGKLSSVIDITQKEGDISGIKGSFGIGIMDISFALEGPMKMKNTSFIITGRKTLTDAFMALASSISQGGEYIIAYGFHDLNGKFTWKPNPSNSVHINLYQGDDYLNYWSKSSSEKYGEKNRYSNSWGNLLLSAKWNRVLSSGLFISNSISYTRYRLKEKQSYSINNEINNIDFKRKYKASVQEISYRFNLRYNLLKQWHLDAGVQSSYIIHTPYSLEQTNMTGNQGKDIIENCEIIFFLDNKITILKKIEFKPGIRFVNYFIKDYTYILPELRMDLNFNIHLNHILSISYSRVSQQSHLLTTSGGIMSNEIWVPSDKQIPIAYSDQYALGWNGFLLNRMFRAEAVVYYKTMNSLATYKEGYSSLSGDPYWDNKIETGGTGKAMGIEFLLRKNYGKWTGFASYSLSRSVRNFPNINGGNEYIFEYDRPHSFSLYVNYQMNEKFSFNFVWFYQTGLPYTPAIGRQHTPSLKQDENGNNFFYEALIYGERNSSRMKDYHRLDFSLNYTKITKRNRKAIWSFSVYNAYNRHNPYYYYFNTSSSGEIYRPENGEDYKPISLYQMSFFPIIPSISYKLFFGVNSSKKKKQTKSKKQKFNNWLYHEN